MSSLSSSWCLPEVILFKVVMGFSPLDMWHADCYCHNCQPAVHLFEVPTLSVHFPTVRRSHFLSLAVPPLVVRAPSVDTFKFVL